MKEELNIGQEETVGEVIGGKLFILLNLNSESGFFRIRMHKFNLGIEDGCTWGDPLIDSADEIDLEKADNFVEVE